MNKEKAMQIAKFFKGKVGETDIITDNETDKEYTLKEIQDIATKGE